MIREILIKASRFSEPQILAILRHADGGVRVPDLCQAWDEQGIGLKMAEQIRRHGRAYDQPHEGS